MDTETFKGWLLDMAEKFKKTRHLYGSTPDMLLLNDFEGWLITEYALFQDDIARDRFADPECCGGACKDLDEEKISGITKFHLGKEET